MKTLFIPLLAYLSCLCACSSTQLISHSPSNFQMLREELTGETGEMILIDGSKTSVKYLNISEETVYWVNNQSFLNVRKFGTDTGSTSTSLIKKMSYKNNSRGGLEGAGLGLIAGIPVGLLMVSNTDKPNNAMEAAFSTPLEITSAFLGGFVLSSLSGALIGMIAGHREHYVFAEPEYATGSYNLNTDTVSTNSDDESTIRIIYDSIIEKGDGYIIILWQGTNIRLERSEYSYRGTTDNGQPFMVIPMDIYKRKFHGQNISGDYQRKIPRQILSKDITPTRVVFSSIVEKGKDYIIIICQGREIRLERSQYNYRGTTDDGQQYVVVPKYVYQTTFQPHNISENKKQIKPQSLISGDAETTRVKFSSIAEKGDGYIVIIYQGRQIRLDRSEYSYRGTTEVGEQYIVVTKYIYETKFERVGRTEDKKQGKPETVKKKDEKEIRVEFTSIIGKGSGYILILWQEKVIRLDQSEYITYDTTEDGKFFIIVPHDIYTSKFK